MITANDLWGLGLAIYLCCVLVLAVAWIVRKIYAWRAARVAARSQARVQDEATAIAEQDAIPTVVHEPVDCDTAIAEQDGTLGQDEQEALLAWAAQHHIARNGLHALRQGGGE
jgi:hypothetical protein